MPQNIVPYFINVWKWPKYKILSVSVFRIWDNLLNLNIQYWPYLLKSLYETSMWGGYPIVNLEMFVCFKKNLNSMLNLMGGRTSVGANCTVLILSSFNSNCILLNAQMWHNKYLSNTLQACKVASQRVMGRRFTLISCLHKHDYFALKLSHTLRSASLLATLIQYHYNQCKF